MMRSANPEPSVSVSAAGRVVVWHRDDAGKVVRDFDSDRDDLDDYPDVKRIARLLSGRAEQEDED